LREKSAHQKFRRIKSKLDIPRAKEEIDVKQAKI
jgi:hypothetical protein